MRTIDLVDGQGLPAPSAHERLFHGAVDMRAKCKERFYLRTIPISSCPKGRLWGYNQSSYLVQLVTWVSLFSG